MKAAKTASAGYELDRSDASHTTTTNCRPFSRWDRILTIVSPTAALAYHSERRVQLWLFLVLCSYIPLLWLLAILLFGSLDIVPTILASEPFTPKRLLEMEFIGPLLPKYLSAAIAFSIWPVVWMVLRIILIVAAWRAGSVVARERQRQREEHFARGNIDIIPGACSHIRRPHWSDGLLLVFGPEMVTSLHSDRRAIVWGVACVSEFSLVSLIISISTFLYLRRMKETAKAIGAAISIGVMAALYIGCMVAAGIFLHLAYRNVKNDQHKPSKSKQKQ